MGFHGYLFVPLGPRRIGLVTAQTNPETALVDIVLSRVVRMVLPGAMATFAGKSLMLELGQLLNLRGMAFVAGFLSGKNRVSCGQFRQSLPAIPAILAKR
jgi:hypothetical protein